MGFKVFKLDLWLGLFQITRKATNTFLGGGSAHNSEEGSVMELERRGDKFRKA
jgi:hypothetical protein